MMAARFAPAFSMALLVTFGLFFFMQSLVMNQKSSKRSDVGAVVIDFGRIKTISETHTKERSLPDKTPPPKAPPPPSLDTAAPAESMQRLAMKSFAPAAISGGLEMVGSLDLGAAPTRDSDIMPLVRIEPRYPSRALTRGIEGWVVVGFSINEKGQVINATTLRSEPPRMFDSAAVRAVTKWKYKPRLVEGIPVMKDGMEVTLTFNIEE